MRVVLDASALLAFIWSEPGSDVVAEVMEEAVISAVNWAEVVSKLHDRGIALELARPLLEELSLEVMAFDEELAFAAGSLRMRSRHLGLSIGDRACLALAAHLSAPAYTADKSWTKLNAGVEVKMVR
jgi:PIN domain nuclease of toxin-antitoxin system